MFRFSFGFELFISVTGMAVPTASQLDYQSLEVGTLIHFNAQTLCTTSGNHSTARCEKAVSGRLPTDEEIKVWNPTQLDTDQWLAAASSFGAKYAVLVVDHFSGFNLWPSVQNNFSIAMTSWKGGHGDVLADFVASCKKFSIKPGFFYSVHNNWRRNVSGHTVHTGGSREDFNNFVAAQMQELLGGNYGDLLGVWFDNGVWIDRMPDLMPLVRTLQPEILCHSCTNGTQDLANPNRGFGLRWCGNEHGSMPLPNWYAVNSSSASFHKQIVKGDSQGDIYCPAETDTVLREHYWFWTNGTESSIKPTKKLVQNYFQSVGRGSNLILAMAPNASGAVPAEDVAAYGKMGKALRCYFSKPLATVALDDSTDGKWEYQLDATIAHGTPLILSLAENLTQGQMVDAWSVEWLLPSGWEVATKGQSVGHKRLLGGLEKIVPSSSVSAFRINTTSLSDSVPAILSTFAVYEKPDGCDSEEFQVEISLV